MFRNSARAAVVLGAALVSTSAFAVTQSVTGEIKSSDAAKHEFVLVSGETFQASSKIRLEKIKAGEKVTVSYNVKNGKMLASKVVPAR
jgi:uncharacterized protein DUF1344